MEDIYTKQLVEMGVSLSTLIVKGTASTVTKKITAIKDEKNVEKLRATYDELINEVILEREEAVRIAQAYKSELDRVVISDDDIKYLNATVSNTIDLLKNMGKDTNSNVQAMELFKNLISADTLKTMQLLGFNYKAAIGEPLTKVCAEKIQAMGKTMSPNKVNKNK